MIEGRLKAAARRLPAWSASCVTALLLVVACGGVGEEGTGAATQSVSVGVLKGIDDSSVTVNGITYERAGATLVDGFGNPLAGDSLRLGMWLEVQGDIDAKGDKGVAQSIRVRPAARGVISAKAAAGLLVNVLDSTVALGNGTVLDGVPDSDALQQGDTIEVHGPLGSVAGDVTASRVERLARPPSGTQAFELRGRVSKLNTQARTLTVGRRPVSYAQASVTLRSALIDGMVVRVSAAAAPQAGQAWDVNKMVADQPLPDNVGFIYAEGVVEGLQSGPLLMLEGLAVDATSANGRSAINAEGLRVAVIGSLVSGTLRAKTVAVIEPGIPVVFTLSGAVADFVSPADFRLRGVAIDASAAAYLSPATPASLANAVRLRVKGTILGRKLIATQVELIP
jgi:Domain of unknown function (DUF5666)